MHETAPYLNPDPDHQPSADEIETRKRWAKRQPLFKIWCSTVHSFRDAPRDIKRQVLRQCERRRDVDKEMASDTPALLDAIKQKALRPAEAGAMNGWMKMTADMLRPLQLQSCREHARQDEVAAKTAEAAAKARPGDAHLYFEAGNAMIIEGQIPHSHACQLVAYGVRAALTTIKTRAKYAGRLIIADESGFDISPTLMIEAFTREIQAQVTDIYKALDVPLG